MILTLALILGFYAAAQAQYPQFRPLQSRWKAFPMQPGKLPLKPPGNSFLPQPRQLQRRPPANCSIPLVNAPGIRTNDVMPVSPSHNIDPHMTRPAPAPPCENWFGK